MCSFSIVMKLALEYKALLHAFKLYKRVVAFLLYNWNHLNCMNFVNMVHVECISVCSCLIWQWVYSATRINAMLTHIHKRRCTACVLIYMMLVLIFMVGFHSLPHFHAHFALSIYFIKRLAFCCRCNCEWWIQKQEFFCCCFTKRVVLQVSKLVKWHLNVFERHK